MAFHPTPAESLPQQLYSLEHACVRVRSLDLAIVLDIEF